MKRYLTCCFILININIYAQQVQWSSKILDFSTQFDTNDFSAVKLLGPPDVPVEGGQHPNAWMPKSPDQREFIAVGFDSAIHVRQIAIFESFNPGAIYKVYLYDERNILHVIGTLEPKPAQRSSRVLHVMIDQTPYKVTALRLIMDGTRVPGYNAIDAIGISSSTELIQKRKNFAYRRNPRLKTEEINLGATGDISDTRPVYSDKMKRLYFTRGYSSENTGSKSDPGDVMVVIYSQANNSFTSPIYLGDEINNIGFNTTNGVLDDGSSEKLLIGNVTGNRNKVEPNIVLVGKDKEGNMTQMEEQKIKKSGIFNMNVDYHMTADRSALFMAAARKNSAGGRDLYVSFNNGSNKWSEPENLGNVINTVADEYAPFFSSEENALYFASKGHGGMGGSDIFRVIRQDNSWKNWSKPENIGGDINSAMDEKYFYFDDASAVAYFARAKNDSVFGIYMVERPRFIDPSPEVALRGRVTEDGDGGPVGAAISLFTVPEDEMYAITFSDEATGLYNIHLRSGYDYRLMGESEGYQPLEMSLSLENKMSAYEYGLDLKISKELIEASPGLQEEIAGIQQSVDKPVQETKVIVPAVRDNQQAVKSTTQPTVPENQTRSETRPQTDNLAAIIPKTETKPETKDETKSEPKTTVKPETLPESETSPKDENRTDGVTRTEPSTVSRPASNTGTRTIGKTEVKTENLIRFNFNSAELLPATASILDAIAQFLQRHDFIKLEIGGFTDHIGDEMYNVELGKRRALAVKNHIVNSGIAASRIRILGFGEKMPIVVTNDVDQLQTNRRVEFNFTK